MLTPSTGWAVVLCCLPYTAAPCLTTPEPFNPKPFSISLVHRLSWGCQASNSRSRVVLPRQKNCQQQQQQQQQYLL
jgi:hypothetical protein